MAAPESGAILVTTQKVTQRAVDVPLTLSVVTGERVRAIGVTDIGQLSAYVPGLNVQIQSPNNPGFVIRGITSDSGSAQESPRVTVYYNGVDISRARGAYQGLYDLDRVEVVKGPQATLFGTAATIGAISMVSAKPRPGTSAQMTAGYGNYGADRIEGYVNTGNDVIAARLAGQWLKRDGYVHNIAADQGDLYAQNQFGLRGSLRYAPTSAFAADLVLTYDRQLNSGTPFVSRSLGSTSVDGIYGAVDLGGSPDSKRDLGLNKLGLHRHVWDGNFTAKWNLNDDWSFTTVNGYRFFNSIEVLDADGSAADYLGFGEHAKGWEASHEGRFTYDTGRLRAALGWNYFIDRSTEKVSFETEEGLFYACSTATSATSCVTADNTVPAARTTARLTRGTYTSLPYAGFYQNEGRNQAFSLFGDATWKLGDRLELTGGLRVLHEKRRSGYAAGVPDSVLYALFYGAHRSLFPGYYDTGGDTYHAQRSYWAALPRFNALYRIDPDLNLYATISEGRRAPVVQLDATSSGGSTVPSLTIVPAEWVWNFEAGIKGRRGVFSGSLGIYYDDYSDFQVDENTTSGVKTVSAGSARNVGIEAELEARVTTWLRAFGNMGFIGGGIDDKASNGVYAGSRFRLQSKWQAAGGLMVDVPVAPGTAVFLTPTATFRSKMDFEEPNEDATSQDAVVLVNLRGGATWREGKLEVAGWVKNLTNRRYLLDAGNAGETFGYPTYIPAEPRMYGVEITARY